MELQQQAQWLRGFLDSLSHSDSISKRQIEILSAKLEQLIKCIEDDEPIYYYEDPNTKKTNVQNTHNSDDLIEPLDDLPF
jgi:hypothetical protein